MPTPPDKIRGRLLRGCIAVETIRFTGETVRPFPKISYESALAKKEILAGCFLCTPNAPRRFFCSDFSMALRGELFSFHGILMKNEGAAVDLGGLRFYGPETEIYR